MRVIPNAHFSYADSLMSFMGNGWIRLRSKSAVILTFPPQKLDSPTNNWGADFLWVNTTQQNLNYRLFNLSWEKMNIREGARFYNILSNALVGTWLKRFEKSDIKGLIPRKPSGRPPMKPKYAKCHRHPKQKKAGCVWEFYSLNRR